MNIGEIVKIRETNSTHSPSVLHSLFVKFVEFHDSLGLKVDNVDLDQGLRDTEEQPEDDVMFAESEEQVLKDIPSVWVLTDGSNENPIFKPVFSTIDKVDIDEAIEQYKYDIIELVAPIHLVKKEVSFVIDGNEIKTSGTLKEIQRFIIANCYFKEIRKTLFSLLINNFEDKEYVHSFLAVIPEHRKYSVMKMKEIK